MAISADTLASSERYSFERRHTKGFRSCLRVVGEPRCGHDAVPPFLPVSSSPIVLVGLDEALRILRLVKMCVQCDDAKRSWFCYYARRIANDRHRLTPIQAILSRTKNSESLFSFIRLADLSLARKMLKSNAGKRSVYTA